MIATTHRAVTRRAIKEQLLNNLWTIVGVALVIPLTIALRWITKGWVRFEVNGFEVFPKVFVENLPWIPTGTVVVATVVAFAAGIVSIVNAATARAYLGAGMSRGSIFRVNLWTWLASALSMALLVALAMVVHSIATGDFSGNLEGDLAQRVGLDVAFEPMDGILWFAPLLMFLVMVYAHAAGYFVSMLFVRLPWWIPVGLAAIALVVLPLLTGFDGRLGHFLTLSDPILSFAIQCLFDTAVFVGISWLLLRRLPIRR